MPKHHDYTLSDDQLKHVQEAMKSPVARVAQRATVLHSLHLGYRVEAVAQMQCLSTASVYNHVQRFEAEGVAGLADKPKSGRPRKATPEYIALLEIILERDPQAMGFAFTVWTQARLRAYLRDQTGISLSRARFQELMQGLGYVYRRPKYTVAHQQDPELRQQVIEALDELKKEPPPKKSNYSLWTKP